MELADGVHATVIITENKFKQMSSMKTARKRQKKKYIEIITNGHNTS